MGTENGGGALGSDAEFAEFAGGGVEGDFGAGEGDDKGAKEEKPRRGPPKEAPITKTGDGVEHIGYNADDDEEGGDDTGEEGDEDENEEGDDKKPKKTPAEHQIDRLKREKRELNARLRALEGGAGTDAIAQRLAALETRLTGGNADDTKTAGKTAPDPSDTAKYPLGHLDDRYIEDKLEWLAEQKAAGIAEAGRQRESANEQERAAIAAQTELLGKVDALAEKGEAIADDFQETVVEAGMRGDWKLTQTTFEAAHDADNGAQILYDLANDPKEAARVAKLPPLKQLAYVLEKDAEISAKAKPRTKPKAGDPPSHKAKGANSRTQGNPATNDLDDFEKQWKRGGK